MNQEEIFTKFYQKHIDKIYRFVYLKVGSIDIAEDLTSDLFLSIWKNLSKNSNFIKNIKNEKAFLYKSAYNKVVDFYKKKKKEEFSSDKIDLMGKEENQATINIEIAEAKKLLNKLSPKYKEVIILYHIEELTIKEISKIIGKSEINIRVMISRGLKKIREMK